MVVDSGIVDNATLEMMMAGNLEGWGILITVLMIAVMAYVCGYLKGRMDEAIGEFRERRRRTAVHYLEE